MAITMQQEITELRLEYLAELRERLEAMRGHAESLPLSSRFRASFPVLLYLSHQMKGTAGSMGFTEVSEIARDLSKALQDFLDDTNGDSREEISRRVVDLLAELEKKLDEAESEYESS
jgi:chemotaxis protein histidine kinase CheA